MPRLHVLADDWLKGALGKIGNRASAEFAIALYHPEYPAAVAPTIATTVPTPLCPPRLKIAQAAGPGGLFRLVLRRGRCPHDHHHGGEQLGCTPCAGQTMALARDRATGPRSGSPGGGTASSTRRATACRWRACCRGSSAARLAIVVRSCRGGYSRQQCHGKFRPVHAKVVVAQMDPADMAHMVSAYSVFFGPIVKKLAATTAVFCQIRFEGLPVARARHKKGERKNRANRHELGNPIPRRRQASADCE
jgi:hypothetical protein